MSYCGGDGSRTGGGSSCSSSDDMRTIDYELNKKETYVWKRALLVI